MDAVLYYTIWWWLPMRARIKLENAWYWLVDAPVWVPPDYTRLIRARSGIPVIPWKKEQ